jgi:predicted nucleic acid-binding protein
VLLTEELQDGQDLDGIRVVDPFQHGPDEIPVA